MVIRMKLNLATLVLAFMASTASAQSNGALASIKMYPGTHCPGSQPSDYHEVILTNENRCTGFCITSPPNFPPFTSVSIEAEGDETNPDERTTCYLWWSHNCGKPGSNQMVATMKNVCTPDVTGMGSMQCFRGTCPNRSQ